MNCFTEGNIIVVSGLVYWPEAIVYFIIIIGLLLLIIVMFLSDVWTLILTAPIHCTVIGEQVM